MNGSEDNEEFEVEKIVAQCKNSEGVIEYKIRWKGFSSDYDTWEPEANLIGCEEVLREFKLKNTMIDNFKKDFEDGEVSETDSSNSDVVHRRPKKSSKGKKRKSKKRTSSKSDNVKVKGESHQLLPEIQTFNDDFGIKVEIAVDPHQGADKNKPQLASSTSFAPNFNMGASELLLNYYTMSSMTPSNMVSAESDVKHELVDLTDSEPVVVIKEEKGCFEEYTEDRQHPQHHQLQHTMSDEIDADDDDNDDSDSDLDGQLKVVINDEADDGLAADKGTDNEQEGEAISQSEKARFWREQLDTGNFKIRKSQRKEHQTSLGDREAAPVLCKDKWTVKIKDIQTEAFYNLPVVQSLQETRQRVEKELLVARSVQPNLDRTEVVRIIEEGNSDAIWRLLLLSTVATEGSPESSVLCCGELLILAAKLGYADIVGMIMRAGVDVNYQTEEGNTALMTACENGHELTCNLLIMNGAHLNCTNKKSESALLKVVTRGHKECLIVLLQYGCDVFSIDSDKGPLQVARQRNLHEMEAIITDYHKRLSDTLTARLLRLMDSTVAISYILFPLRVVSLYEEKDFNFEFDAKIPPVKEDECNLLLIFTGLIQDRQIRCCLEQVTPIKSVVLNEIDQQSLVPDDKNYVVSMSPILDGKNVLNIKCESTVNCRWVRLLVIGFRVKVNVNKPT